MDLAAVDIPALILALVIATVFTVALMFAHRGDNHRRGWITAGMLALVVAALGVVDLLRETPRETHLATAILGAGIPALGALGMVRATTRVRAWVRWLVVFLTALLLLFGGVLLGATMVPRLLG